MKKILIFLSVLFSLSLIAIALAFWNLNSIVDKFKPTLEKQISGIIHTPIELGKISVSVFPTTSLTVNEVIVTGTSQKAKLGELSVSVDFWKIISGKMEINKILLRDGNIDILKQKSGNLIIAGIDLSKQNSTPQTNSTPKKNDSPKNTDTQSSAANFDITKAEIENFTVTYIDESFPVPLRLPLKDINFSLSNFSLKGGKADLSLTLPASKKDGLKFQSDFSFKNLNSFNFLEVLSKISFENNLEIDAANLKSLNEILSSLGTPLKEQGIELSDLLSLNLKIGNTKTKNIDLQGKINLDKAFIKYQDKFQKNNTQLTSIDFSGDMDFKKLLIGSDNTALDLKELVLKLGKNEIKSKLNFGKNGGVLSVKLNSFNPESLNEFTNLIKAYDLKGAINSDLQVQYKKDSPINIQGPISLKNLSLSYLNPKTQKNINIQNINGDILAEDSFLKVKSLSGSIFDGILNLKGKLPLSNSLVELDINAKDFDLAKMQEATTGDVKVKGTLASFQTNIKTDYKNLLPTLIGSANSSAIKGDIQGVSLLGEVWEAVSKVPGFSESLKNALPEKYLPLINSKTTAFDDIKMDLSFANNNANLKSFSLKHSAYSLEGTGNVGFAGDLSVKAQFKLDAGFTNAIISKVPEFKLFLDENNNVVFPVSISKSASRGFSVIPDLGDITKRAAKNTAKQVLKKELGKKLEGKIPGIGNEAGKLIDSLF